jgi:predicted DNA-binding transcriptional regulator YafY
MAQKRTPVPAVTSRAVTAERAARLYCLLKLIDRQPQTRKALRRTLRYDVRSFYRDIELFRSCGINLFLRGGCYYLPDAVTVAIARLPFPDPSLTLGEAQELAKGRNLAQRKLKQQITRIIKASRRKSR